jgi:hypothetical protein
LTLASEPHCAFAAGAVMDASKSIPKAIVNDLKIAFIGLNPPLTCLEESARNACAGTMDGKS